MVAELLVTSATRTLPMSGCGGCTKEAGTVMVKKLKYVRMGARISGTLLMNSLLHRRVLPLPASGGTHRSVSIRGSPFLESRR
jgi:hypothetical protein